MATTGPSGPALRIESGDIIDVDTLLTNTPEGLKRAGVADEKSRRRSRRVEQVTGDRRGPGGHISPPLYIEGAEPGDVLEVNVLSIDLAIDYGYNGCRDFFRTTVIPRSRRKSSPSIAAR